MLSSEKCEIGNSFISQHDNYLKHTANAVKQFQMSLKDPGELFLKITKRNYKKVCLKEFRQSWRISVVVSDTGFQACQKLS